MVFFLIVNFHKMNYETLTAHQYNLYINLTFLNKISSGFRDKRLEGLFIASNLGISSRS